MASSPACTTGLPPRTYDVSRDCYAAGECSRCGITQPGTRYVCSGCTSEPFNDGGCDVHGAGFPIVFMPGQCTQDTDGSWCCLSTNADAGPPQQCSEIDSEAAACTGASLSDGTTVPVAYSCPVDRITGYADTTSMPGRTCAPGRMNYGTVNASPYASAHDAIACCAN
ncbi:MAG: hypothetical protein ACRENE_05495 [Polyangiaceae bacterium]